MTQQTGTDDPLLAHFKGQLQGSLNRDQAPLDNDTNKRMQGYIVEQMSEGLEVDSASKTRVQADSDQGRLRFRAYIDGQSYRFRQTQTSNRPYYPSESAERDFEFER